MLKTEIKTDVAVILILTSHENDVISGRGSAANRHVGNKNFRELVSWNKSLYVQLTKRDKCAMAREIYNIIINQNPPGRFIQKSPDSYIWCEIGKPRALEKISQALREKSYPKSKNIALSSDQHNSPYLRPIERRIGPIPYPSKIISLTRDQNLPRNQVPGTSSDGRASFTRIAIPPQLEVKFFPMSYYPNGVALENNKFSIKDNVKVNTNSSKGFVPRPPPAPEIGYRARLLLTRQVSDDSYGSTQFRRDSGSSLFRSSEQHSNRPHRHESFLGSITECIPFQHNFSARPMIPSPSPPRSSSSDDIPLFCQYPPKDASRCAWSYPRQQVPSCPRQQVHNHQVTPHDLCFTRKWHQNQIKSSFNHLPAPTPLLSNQLYPKSENELRSRISVVSPIDQSPSQGFRNTYDSRVLKAINESKKELESPFLIHTCNNIDSSSPNELNHIKTGTEERRRTLSTAYINYGDTLKEKLNAEKSSNNKSTPLDNEDLVDPKNSSAELGGLLALTRAASLMQKQEDQIRIP